MENPTRFDLNAAVRAWRESMSHLPAVPPESLAELESHLRDSVETLRAGRLSDEEAFLIATRRLGGAPALQEEFSKVNRKEIWLERLFWIVAGTLALQWAGMVARALSDTALWGAVVGAGYRPGESSRVPMGLAYGLLQCGILAVVIVAFVRLGRAASDRLNNLVSRVVQYRAGTVLAVALVSVGLLAAGTGWSLLGTRLLMKTLPPQDFGALSYLRGVSYMFSSAFQTFAIVLGGVLLYRRRLQRKAASEFASPA
jgi:hypothetical protein